MWPDSRAHIRRNVYACGGILHGAQSCLYVSFAVRRVFDATASRQSAFLLSSVSDALYSHGIALQRTWFAPLFDVYSRAKRATLFDGPSHDSHQRTLAVLAARATLLCLTLLLTAFIVSSASIVYMKEKSEKEPTKHAHAHTRTRYAWP